MNNFLPLSPAQSWALIGMMAIACVLVTYPIYSFDQFLSLAIWNCKLTGIKGIGYAIRGLEAYEILRERVIEVSKNAVGYTATTSNRETNFKYVVITSKTDVGNPEYDDAIRLAGDDERLKNALLPDCRVKNYFILDNKETGEKTEFFVVYVKYDNAHLVELALNNFFDDEFYAASREARQKSA